jgi:hypothetical protein
MKTLPRIAAEMALHVLAYNLTRIMNIMGVQPLLAARRLSHLHSRLPFDQRTVKRPGPTSFIPHLT